MNYTEKEKLRWRKERVFSYSVVEFFYDTSFIDYRPLFYFISPGVKFREVDHTFRILPSQASADRITSMFYHFDRQMADRIQGTASQLLREMQNRIAEIERQHEMEEIKLLIDYDYLTKKYNCQILND